MKQFWNGTEVKRVVTWRDRMHDYPRDTYIGYASWKEGDIHKSTQVEADEPAGCHAQLDEVLENYFQTKESS